ncbi:MAG: hypothetical protein IT585_12065, partial [candidate division Zixibacteria bacterium]|nr:hypothetical protein [candidate division Zixibacteria bacterium]
MTFWEKLGGLDRRWVYLLVAITVMIPVIFPVELPMAVTPEARKLYDAVEALPDSSVVMLTFDYYASATPETLPV